MSCFIIQNLPGSSFPAMKFETHGLPPQINIGSLPCPTESRSHLHFYTNTRFLLHDIPHDTFDTSNLKLEPVRAD